jgi:hypothetical protein
VRRLTLLLSVVCFLMVAAPVALAQSGDSDGDGITDSIDSCPQQPGPQERGGCPIPDGDGDGTPDSNDTCPDEPGPDNGCPPPVFRSLITFRGGYDLGDIAADPADAGQAQCYGSGDDLCSFTATLTLDAASAKKLGLRNRKIGSMKATTNKQQRAYDLRFVNFRWAVSKKVKRALKTVKSVKLTMAGTYARGSGARQKFKPVTFKAVKNYKRSSFPGLDTRPPRGDGETDE